MTFSRRCGLSFCSAYRWVISVLLLILSISGVKFYMFFNFLINMLISEDLTTEEDFQRALDANPDEPPLYFHLGYYVT